MIGTMQALVKTRPGRGNIEVREVPVPHAGAGEVRVAVIATGICGTDLHIADEEFASRPPVVMGHEVSGTVDEVGPGAQATWLGQRVALETYASTCQACHYCRSGRANLCAERRSIGSYVDGGFAGHIVVPARNLHLVDESVGPLAGALYEPLACVAHSLCDPPVACPGDAALVVGPGPIGLLAAQVLRAQGASVVVAGAAGDTVRLAAAAALGFVTVRSEEIKMWPDGNFAVVAECSGTESGVATGLEATAKGGRFVQVGLGGHPVMVQLDLICLKELQVTSGNASTPESWERAESLVGSRSVRLDELVSASYPLTSWREAFARVRSGDAVKVVLQPTQT
jgi:L-iditol 2-dehydrogenase